jgi:protein-S-isoprenylcysteine O-methyltransferase Ste14
MKKQLMWFVIGVIAGTIGVTTLSAIEMGRYWSGKEIGRVIYLLEKIEVNTRRK